MSIVTFGVQFGGYWMQVYDEDFVYHGGEVRTVECKVEELLERLAITLDLSLNVHKVWYKLPFEDMNQRKVLCASDVDAIRKLSEAAEWTRVVNVFVVNTVQHPDDIGGEEVRRDLFSDLTVNVAESDSEEFDYHNTPPNSDDEESDNETVRCKRGSGILKLRQVFDGLDEFKEALVDYVLKEKWNIMLYRWGKENSGAKCSKDGCEWSIFCSFEEPVGKWMVKRYDDNHSCSKDSSSRIIKAGVIAKLFLEEVRADADIKPKTIQDQMVQRWGLITSHDKCRKAKEKALEIIRKEHEEQFSRLKDYRTELIRSNEDSTIDLETFFGDDGSEYFKRIYVCFAVIRNTWKSWCRPIFGLDGCFLKCTLKGQLLAAVGRDANNGMYPIAWAVVDVENEDNWSWFIHKLRRDLELEDGLGFTIISDRQKGLLNAVTRELPLAEHRMCARHIYGNLKKIFPNQHHMKKMFWKLAESYTRPEYESNLEAIKNYDIRLYNAIMERNPMNCSMAFCRTNSSCIDIHNNISESFNNAIDPARYLPMVEMLETIKKKAMIRCDQRRAKALSHEGRFTPKIMEILDVEQEKAVKFCKMVPGTDGRCEVLEFGQPVSINMRTKECTCRRWQMSGVPCRHALRVCLEKKLNREDYIANWYLTSRQQRIYCESIRPVNGMQYWERCGSVILPPPSMIDQVANRKGRKPKPKRKKTRNESPTKKVGTRKKRVMHCGRCGFAGHNAKKCTNIGVQVSRRMKKKSTTRDNEEGDYAGENGGYESGYEWPSQSQN